MKLSLILLSFTTLILFSCKDDDAGHPCGVDLESLPILSTCDDSIYDDGQAREIFKVVETMPSFPGCEHIGDKAERQECSDQKMLDFIAENLAYPQDAIDHKIEGMVVVRFVVDTTGCLAGIEAVRGIGCGCEEEALRVVSQMPNWNSGEQRG